MPRILVADDNSNIQKMVALALEERGIDVVSVGNGEAAVRRIPDLSPDLVLADVFMPVRNGYEVCEFVKTNERFSHVPVILLVGAFDPLDEKEARRVGADGVLKKPFVPPDPLIAMVTSALEKNPHVAAEMEKARETPAPVAEPELPAIALEPPARVTPKPLPDFPEPSPEEAALIYGFEKKKIEKSEDEEESDSRPRFSLKRPESEEDFDHATTSRDWRRGAADFEIPDDLNSKPITPDEGFSSVAFPSEQNASAKRVSVPDPAPQEAPRASVPPVNSVPAFTTVEEETSSHPIGFTTPPTATDSATKSRFSGHKEPDRPAQPEQSSPAAEAQPDHSTEMDPLPSPSEYAEDGWMSALLGKFRRGKAPDGESGDAKNTQAAGSSSQAVSAASGPLARTPEPAFAPPEAPLPPPLERIVAALPSHTERQEAAPTTSETDEPGQPSQSESNFFAHELREVPNAPPAESWFAANPTTLDDSGLSQGTVSTFSADTVGNLLASPADVNDQERSQFSAGFTAKPASGTGPETRPDPVYEPPSYIEASSGEEEPTSEDRKQPVFSTDAESARDEATSTSSLPRGLDRNSSNDATRQEHLDSIFAPPLPDAAAEPAVTSESAIPANASSERIPTTTPPNREAIADIPFLMPPPPAPFEPASASEGSHAADPVEPPSVDAVVNRLLEKLQPQIHELLAKDLLKPIVENLLQQELANKSK
ncbi:MAG: response regulator [Candidatus Acidiferrales bacterium]